MGARTDKIIGRSKQALGAVIGNETMSAKGSAKRTRASSRAKSTQPSVRHRTRLKGPEGQGRPKLNNRPNSGKPPASLP